MKKLLIVGAVAVTVLLATGTKQAQAQTAYPSVSGVTAFTQGANFMSLAGYLRYRYFFESGRWITREEAQEAVRSQVG